MRILPQHAPRWPTLPYHRRPKGQSGSGGNEKRVGCYLEPHSSCNSCNSEVGALEVSVQLFALMPTCLPHLLLDFLFLLWFTNLTVG